MKVKITSWKAVAAWRWTLPQDDCCSVCRNPYDGTCAKCRFPGDGCPITRGQCGHTFHTHCISSWVNDHATNRNCPMCRQRWAYKDGALMAGHGSLIPRAQQPPVQTVVVDQ